MSPPVDDPITRHGWGKELRWLLGAAAVLFVLASIHRALGFEQTRRETVEAAQQGAAEKVAIARTRIRERLLQVRRINDQLNHALATEPLERAAIEARLRETLGQEHQLFGVGVAFAPEALGPGSPLHEPGSSRYAPYYVDRDGTIEASPIEYDYTVHDCDEYDPRRPERCRNVWYGRTLARGAAWQEPHEGPASRQRIANYVSPLTRDEPVGAAKGRMGVVFTTLSTREYRQLLSELHLGPHSRALLISAADAFIVPPGPPTSESPTLVEQWDELAASAGDTSLAELLAEVRGIEGRSGEPPLLYDPLAEGERWAFAEPIGDGTGWLPMLRDSPNVREGHTVMSHVRGVHAGNASDAYQPSAIAGAVTNAPSTAVATTAAAASAMCLRWLGVRARGRRGTRSVGQVVSVGMPRHVARRVPNPRPARLRRTRGAPPRPRRNRAPRGERVA